MLKITKVKPMFTSVLVTANRFENDEKQNGIIVSKKGDLKLWQTVLEVGSSVRNIKAGDKVMIDISRYAVKKYDNTSAHEKMGANPVIQFMLNWVEIHNEDGSVVTNLMLDERDIMYSFEGEEVEPKIVEAEKPKLII